MKKAVFQRFLEKVTELTFLQRIELVETVSQLDEEQQVNDLAELAFAEDAHCPHCQHRDLGTKGHDKSGVIRYICRNCRRTFNAFHNTPLFGLHRRDRILSNAQQMIEGQTIRRTAKNIGVSASCAFKFRHRMLEHFHDQEDHHLSGVVEIDEMLFCYSRKGDRHLAERDLQLTDGSIQDRTEKPFISVVTCRDHENHELDFIGGFGRVDALILNFELHQVIASNALLVSRPSRSIQVFAKHAHLRHVRLNTADDTYGVNPISMEGVSSYEQRFLGWMERFKGVATKYLNHYLGWYHGLSVKRLRSPEVFMAFSL